MLSFLLAVAVAVIADTAWFMAWRARSVGRFRVTRDSPTSFAFTSRTGTFTVHRTTGRLLYTQDGQRHALPLADLRGLEYRVDERSAVLEELFLGFGVTDWLGAYRDAVEWFSIAAVASDGRRIPLFLSGAYQRREFLAGWYVDRQAEWLGRLGWITDVEAQAEAALALIQARSGCARLL